MTTAVPAFVLEFIDEIHGVSFFFFSGFKTFYLHIKKLCIPIIKII